MKYLINILLFLAICPIIRATSCVDRIYQEDKLNLYLCQNHSDFNETRGLLYKAKAKVLNDYIKEKINNGKLIDKKFEIQIYDAVLTYPQLMLTQGKNGYFVTLTGFLSLQNLVTIIDYFSKPDWKPILLGNDFYNVGKEIVMNKINNFYKQNSINETFTYQPFSVWKKDEVSLKYLNDSLKYFMNNIPLAFKTTSSLPVKINDRYLFFQSDSIFVVHDMQIIKSIKIDKTWKDTDEDFDVYVFSKWVNICWGGKDNWLYSYSYSNNKFYKKR